MGRSSYTPEQNRAYLADRYAAQRQWMFDYLGQHACVLCGSTEDLQFDHIDPKTKSFDVGRLWAQHDLLRVLAPELDKCQVLCGPHHREKSGREQTTRQTGQITHGSRTGWMKSGCTCPACREARNDWNAERKEVRRKDDGRGAYKRPSIHGERLHYRRGCRCDECRAANAAAQRARRA